MKHTNKKGFTIVELVIVIAVIAILAAVLIPNLSRLVTKADKSAAMQEAKAAMDNDLINAEGDLANMTKYVDSNGNQYYVTATYKAGNIPSGATVYSATTAGDVTTLTKVTGTASGEGDFYVAEQYAGKYTAATESASAKYSVKITKSSTEYTCEYDFTTGAWTVNP